MRHLLLILSFLPAVLPAQDPTFAPPERIDLASAQKGAILHYDMDGDGQRDLLTGFGFIWVHRNEGSAEKPRFAEPYKLHVGEKEFVAPGG